VMHVIPNHMLEQYGNDVTALYPNARVLLINAKDLGRADKRQQTMSRVATEDWDAVVVTHGAFEKLPVSKQTQSSFIQQEIAQIDAELEAMEQASRGDKSGAHRRQSSAQKRTVKQLEKKKKRLKAKLQRMASGKKDEAITFEQLGVDQVFVDEAHAFKNLATYSRKDRVSGIPSGSGSKRAFDMYMKTQYLQRRCARCGRFVPQSGVCLKCGGKTEIAEGGVTFATGTPIANSVAEMYTMMRYLQGDRLRELGLEHFDAWANQFGDIVTSLEMKPSGDGYREKARFAQFNNVPELLRLWGETSDVLPDPKALGLPIPKVAGDEPVRVSAPPSDWLKKFVQKCSDRAEKLPSTDPKDDNMLKIIGDANRAALDRRLIDPSLPDDPNSKVNLAVDNIEQIYRDTTGVKVEGMEEPQNMAQVIFLDTSTPKSGFNVYDDIKDKLVARGVPEDEIAFIHDAGNDAEKQALFDKINAGEVRVILGSTEKMGSGTNIQQRLAALHHLDAPWRPADIEQREGRILRPGNMNAEVGIYRYATEESFDVYRWQTLETKARFIAQVMTGDMQGRSMEDIDEVTMGYAQMKALATGNPVFIEKAQVESDLIRLAGLQRSYRDKNFQMRSGMSRAEAVIKGSRQAIEDMLEAETKVATAPKRFQATFGEGQQTFEKKSEAGEAFMKELRRVGTTLTKNRSTREEMVGRIRGFPVIVKGRGTQLPKVVVRLSKDVEVEVAPSKSPTGNMTKLMNAVDSLPAHIEEARADIAESQQRIVGLNTELAKPFEHQADLDQLQQRLSALNAEINSLEKEGREKVANNIDED
jgi:hypothetical protein